MSLTPLDPQKLVEDRKLDTASLRRFTRRVGVLGSFNRRPEKRGPYLFSGNTDGKHEFLQRGTINYGNFVDFVEPSIGEKLINEEGFFFKIPDVPQDDVSVRGHRIGDDSFFITLGRKSKEKDEKDKKNEEEELGLSSGAEILKGVRASLERFIEFQTRNDEIINLFSKMLDKIGDKLPGLPFFKFADGTPLPAGFVPLFFNYLHQLGDDAAFPMKKLWPTEQVEADEIWHPFIKGNNKKRNRALLSDVLQAFKQFLTDPKSMKKKTPLETTVHDSLGKLCAKSEVTELHDAFKGAGQAFRYLREVLRSKISMSMIAEWAYEEYLEHGEYKKKEWDSLYERIMKGEGFAPAVKRMPGVEQDRLESRLESETALLIETLWVQATEDEGPKLPATLEEMAERLDKLKGKAPTDRLEHLEWLRKKKVIAGDAVPKWLDDLSLLGLQLTAEGFRSAAAMIKKIAPEIQESFCKVFANDPANKNAAKSFIAANKSLIRDVVFPVLMASPRLTPERLVELFCEKAQSTYTYAILLDDDVLKKVLEVTTTYANFIQERLKEKAPAKKGKTAFTTFALAEKDEQKLIVDMLPEFLQAVLFKAGANLGNVQALEAMVREYVKSIRAVASKGEAGPGNLVMNQRDGKDHSIDATAPVVSEETLDRVTETARDHIQQRSSQSSAKSTAAGKRPVAPRRAAPAKKEEDDDEAEDPVEKSANDSKTAQHVAEEADRHAERRKQKVESYRKTVSDLAAKNRKELSAFSYREEKIEFLLKEGLAAVSGDYQAKKEKLNSDVEGAEKAKGDDLKKARQELNLFESVDKPDDDLLRDEIVKLPDLAPPPTAGKGDPLDSDILAWIAEESESEGELEDKVRERVLDLSKRLENAFQQIYATYKTKKHLTGYCSQVERLMLSKLLLLFEPDLDLGKQMSEYYHLLMDLIEEPDIATFKKRFSPTKYFTISRPSDLKAWRSVLKASGDAALRGVKTFVSELLGMEHLLSTVSDKADVEIIVWNMTATDFLDSLDIGGAGDPDLTDAFNPINLRENHFKLPSVLYVSDSAFGWGQDAELRKYEFLTNLNKKVRIQGNEVLIVPTVVMSYTGLGSKSVKSAEDYDPPPSLDIPDDLCFPFIRFGPAPLEQTRPDYQTTIPPGYHFLRYFLGQEPKERIHEKLTKGKSPDTATYILGKANRPLHRDFLDLTYSTPRCLWADMYLLSLTVMALQLNEHALAGTPSTLDANLLKDFFSIFVREGAAATELHNGTVGRFLKDCFWTQHQPGGSAEGLVNASDLETINRGESPPEWALQNVNFTLRTGRQQHRGIGWFNNLWERFGLPPGTIPPVTT